MKKLRLTFNKDIDEYPEIKNIIDDIKTKFEVIEDDDTFDLLRYVDINANLLSVGVSDIQICISSVLKPHIFIALYNKYLYKVEMYL